MELDKYEYKFSIGGTVEDSGETTGTLRTFRPVKGFIIPCGITYSFSVRAYGNGSTYSASWGAWASTRITKPSCGPEDPPPAPSNPTASVSGTSSFFFSWSTLSGASKYEYEFSIDGGVEDSGETTDTSNSFTPAKRVIIPRLTYTFRVRAYGNGSTYLAIWGDWASTSYSIDPPDPPAPSISASTKSSSRIDVSWSQRTGIEKYRVWLSPNGRSPWTTLTSDETGTSYPATGLTPNTTYYFRAYAYGDGTTYAAKWSPVSNVDSATTHRVTPTNRPPVVETQISAQSLTVGGNDVSIGLSDKFSDPDGDTLTYSARSSNTNVVTVPADVSGTSLSITPADAGSTTVTVTASDPSGSSVSQSFTVTVGTVPANIPPVVEIQISSQTLRVGGSSTTIGLANKFSDPDGDTLTFTASSSNESIATVPANVSGTSLSISPVGAGSATVTVTASDPGGLSVSQMFTVTVNSIPDPPNRRPTVTINTSGSTVAGGARVSLDATASDPDGDALTYIWSGSGSFADPSALVTTWTAPAAQSSERTYELTITVSDRSLSASDSVSFIVPTPCNPTFGNKSVSDMSWTQGAPIASFTLPVATGRNCSLTYTLSPALPNGVSLDSRTREVSGTPAPAMTRTQYTWQASDAGAAATLIFHITVTPPLPAISISRHSSTLPNVTEGQNVIFLLSMSPAPTTDLKVNISITEMGSFLEGMAPSEVMIARGSRTAHVTLKTVDDATDEANGTIDAEIIRGTGYRVGIASSASVPVEDNDVMLNAPMNLTITPMSMRRAKLTWTGDPNAVNDSNLADDYAVQVRRPGRTEWQNPNLREQSGASAVILLDVIWEEYSDAMPPVLLESGGLANLSHGVDYQYRIKALYDFDTTDTSDPYVDSDWSKSVGLMDTPITSINGISSDTDGQALVKWSRVPGAVEYKLRWRRIPAAADSTVVWKTLIKRTSGHEWSPNYAESESDWSDYVTAEPGKLEQELTGLKIGDFGDVYAIQLVYERHNETEGFSGRESYVWPWPSTKKFPNDGAKVATYPFVGHWPSKEYRYSVCGDTFLGDWDSLIEDAFNQWDAATGIVSTTSVISNCEVDDNIPFTLFTGIFNRINEVYRIDTEDDHERVAYTRNLANLMMNLPNGPGTPYVCIFFAPSCTMSPVDDDQPRKYGGLRDPWRYARHELPGLYDDESIGSVDVLISQERDNTRLDIPIAVRFNTCIGPAWANYTNYEMMVHEAGHALGLLNRLPFSNDWEYYARDHSTILDSVMNYDEQIPKNLLTDGTIRQEKDCSPHPFDIMAIYALYQGVD